jgi:hypothetical protein
MITLAKTIRRVVDAYVDRRDFDGSRPADTGRSGYHPSTLDPAEFSHGHENVSETPGNNGPSGKVGVRQNSNLQPDRYERPALTIELQAP